MSNKLDLSKDLIGRRALVTGGTRGIGAAIAQRLLDAGAKVVVGARTRDEDTPTETTFVPGDVTTSEGVDAIATKALAALGGLDILVNNAGGARAGGAQLLLAHARGGTRTERHPCEHRVARRHLDAGFRGI